MNHNIFVREKWNARLDLTLKVFPLKDEGWGIKGFYLELSRPCHNHHIILTECMVVSLDQDG